MPNQKTSRTLNRYRPHLFASNSMAQNLSSNRPIKPPVVVLSHLLLAPTPQRLQLPTVLDIESKEKSLP